MHTNLYVRPGHIPGVLREAPRWLPYRRDGRRKIPLGPDSRPCDANDPITWQTFEDAARPYFAERPRADGLGFALINSGFTIIDLDGAVEPSGEVASDAKRLIEAFGSYCELSPSERGLHIILKADLPGGNRRVPGFELLGSGFVTVTGHPISRSPIRAGSEEWTRLLRGLPPQLALRATGVASASTPTRPEIEAILARAMPNARFRRLWHGDWSEYPSRSEADAAFMMHVVRNGADLGTAVVLLRTSALRRAKHRREDYVVRQAVFAITTVESHLPRWSGVTIVPQDSRDREAVGRLEEHPILGRDASLLIRLGTEIAARVDSGQHPDHDCFWRISPQGLSGDFPSQPGLAPPERITSRRGALKALRRLAAAGVIDLRPGHDRIVWNDGGRQRARTGVVTLVRVDGTNFASILDGFIRRIDTPCLCIGNSLAKREPEGKHEVRSAID